MKPRTNLLAPTFLLLCAAFAVLGGGTTAGVVNPRWQMVALLLIGLGGAGWAFLRWRRRWLWQPSALDYAIVMWIAVLAFTTLANLDVWRRVAIGLWFVGLYVVLWYALHDLMSGGVLRREHLFMGLLGIGALVILSALNQFATLLPQFLAARVIPTVFNFPISDVFRLGGWLINPNVLAALLSVLIPLLLARVVVGRLRWLWLVYLLVAGFVLVFTFSRGGWLATAVGVGIFLALLMQHYGLLSPRRLLDWWRAQRGLPKIVSTLAVLGVLLAALAVLVVVLKVSDTASRGGDQRATFYRLSLDLFAEKPITGHGLFTFGRYLLASDSMPPRQIHSHGHSAPLTIMAELGLPGLIALGVTLLAIFQAARNRWRQISGPDRILFAGTLAALTAYGVDHLLDFAAILAVIALLGIVLLVAAFAPDAPTRRVRSKTPQIAGWLAIGVCALLLATGLWSNSAQSRYATAITTGTSFEAVAQGIGEAAASDPAMPAYPLIQGLYYGFAANQPGPNAAAAAQNAITALERFVATEPSYGPAWANLSAMYWQIGNQARAIESMKRAAELNADEWRVHYNLGRYLEAVGQPDAATKAYQNAVEVTARLEYLKGGYDIRLLPEWTQSPLRVAAGQAIANKYPLSEMAQTVFAIEAGDLTKAAQIWGNAPKLQRDTLAGLLIDVFLAQNQGQSDEVERTRLANSFDSYNRYLLLINVRPEPSIWLDLASANAARVRGDSTAVQAALQSAQVALSRYAYTGFDLVSAQFLRLGVSDFWVPQFDAPTIDPVVASLYNYFKNQVAQ